MYVYTHAQMYVYVYIYDIYVYKCNFVVSYKQVEAFVRKFFD